MRYRITPLQPEDWPAVRSIYAEGIATGNATFEIETPDWEKWNAVHRQDCRLVAREAGGAGAVLGWAALSPISLRRVYAGVAEVSAYVAASALGQGVGKALMQALIEDSEQAGVWMLQAGIFPENSASLRLHKAHGFREVGIRRRIGKLGETWRDVVLLERRSSSAGV